MCVCVWGGGGGAGGRERSGSNEWVKEMETRIVLALNYVLQVNFRLDIMLFELIKK